MSATISRTEGRIDMPELHDATQAVNEDGFDWGDLQRPDAPTQRQRAYIEALALKTGTPLQNLTSMTSSEASALIFGLLNPEAAWRMFYLYRGITRGYVVFKKKPVWPYHVRYRRG